MEIKMEILNQNLLIRRSELKSNNENCLNWRPEALDLNSFELDLNHNFMFMEWNLLCKQFKNQNILFPWEFIYGIHYSNEMQKKVK